MTEAEWLKCNDPEPLALHVLGHACARKLRLWACACGREVTLGLQNPLIDKALDFFEIAAEVAGSAEVEEQLLAELASESEKEPSIAFSFAVGAVIQSQCLGMNKGFESIFALAFRQFASAKAFLGFSIDQPQEPSDLPDQRARRALEFRSAQQKQSDLARDIFGNPFHPVAFSSSWLASTAVTLAQQMYESRDFSAMPILADALQDAGCDSADVLDHCRGPGSHVRGCWVVDLILGKE